MNTSMNISEAGKSGRKILDKLKQYDYIRYLDGDKLTAGTRLLTTVDAAKMYKVYRTSVLVRRLNQLSTHTSED